MVVAATRLRNDPTRRFTFINAWNEWGEGCHLEPDLRWQTQYLEATSAAVRGAPFMRLSLEENLRRIAVHLQRADLSTEDALLREAAMVRDALLDLAHGRTSLPMAAE